MNGYLVSSMINNGCAELSMKQTCLIYNIVLFHDLDTCEILIVRIETLLSE